MRTALVASFVVLGLVAGCSASDNEATGSDDIVAAGPNIAPTDPCTARMHYMQKDAYKDTAGRKSGRFWPPHTTTILEVTCKTSHGEEKLTPFEANHGTEPGTKLASGEEILVEQDMDEDKVTTSASWSEMQKLVESYESCECQSDAFLSLDKVNEGIVEIVKELSRIIECSEPQDVITTAIKDRDVATLKRVLLTCRLRTFNPIEMIRAAHGVEEEVEKTLVGKHVCNNDALLQADLFARFREKKDARACDPHDRDRCHFPKLFFRPDHEVR